MKPQGTLWTTLEIAGLAQPPFIIVMPASREGWTRKMDFSITGSDGAGRAKKSLSFTGNVKYKQHFHELHPKVTLLQPL